MAIESLRCKECGTEYPLDARYVCEQCFGPLEVAYDYSDLDVAEVRRKIQAGPRSIWRYSDFLPVRVSAPRLGSRRARPRSCAPTGWPSGWGSASSTSRTTPPTQPIRSRTASSRWPWPRRSSSASTSSPAPRREPRQRGGGPRRDAGLESYVFIPANLEEQKVLATGIYGTNLVAVSGNYDDVNRLCTEISGEHDWAFVNVNLRPYYAEGSKTLAYEIAEQLGFTLPDRVVAPIASGSLFTKIGRGFAEWLELGC